MHNHLTVPEAAKALGISEGAIRQRINRGTLEHEKGDDGRVYVRIRDTNDVQDNVQHGTYDLSVLVESLQDQVQYLRQKLDESEEANRENRRLLAAAFERIPEIEAPESRQDNLSEPRESRDMSSAEPGAPYGTSRQEAEESLQARKRSWWREFLGME